MFVYNKIFNGNQSLWVTKNQTIAKAGIGLPQGVWRFDVVDGTDHVIIYTENTEVGVPTPSEAPTVTGVSPPTGPTGVINPVIITGTNLFGTTSVTFGGTAATGISVISGTTITATAPTHTAGLVNVVVTTPNGTATGTGVYTYGNSPTVTGVSPPTGPTGIVNPVTITGTNLFGATSITFDSATSGFSVTNGTSISATAPTHAAGPVNVVVITPNGTATGTYTYFTNYPGFTAEAWVKWNNDPSSGVQYATIVINGSSDPNRNYQLQITNNRFELAIAPTGSSNGQWIYSLKTLTGYNMVSGTWYYVTGVYNQTPGTMTLFVDGSLDVGGPIGSSGLKSVSGPITLQWGGTGGITFGGNTGQRIFNGTVKGNTYPRALSLAEIQVHSLYPPT